MPFLMSATNYLEETKQLLITFQVLRFFQKNSCFMYYFPDCFIVGHKFLILRFISYERDYQNQFFFNPVLEAPFMSDLIQVFADLVSQKATNQKFTTPISAFV